MDASKVIGFLFLAVFLSGCGGNSLHPDFVLPAIEANYPSAEFYLGNKRKVGLGFCELKQGQDLKDCDLKVQGYYKGTVRFATTCRSDQDLNDSVRYTQNAVVPYLLSGQATESCGVSFVVSPEYPDEDATGVVIHSFMGHLLVRVKKDAYPWQGFVDKVNQASLSQKISILVGNRTSTRLFLESDRCNVHIDKDIPVFEKKATIILSEVMTPMIKTCALNGAVFDENNDPIRITWLVSSYDSRFVPLPIPVISFGKKMFVEGDNNVSVIGFDGKFVLSGKAGFKFNTEAPHVVRMLTTGGRSIIGEYDNINRSWSWIY